MNEQEIKTEEMQSDKKEQRKEKMANLWKNTKEGISKGAKVVSETTKKTIHEQKLKHYNPLFKEEFKSKSYKLPNVIQIVDDAERRDIDVCEGAIGWTSKVNGVEVLYLYDEWIKESKIKFVPYVKVDAVYYMDNFDRNQFIITDRIFERSTNEKIAELERIAYCLGAKMCSIEMSEEDYSKTSSKMGTSVSREYAVKQRADNKKKSKEEEDSQNSKFKSDIVSVSMNSQIDVSNSRLQSGRSVAHFEGSDNPTRPQLKWFAYDDNITGLIEMRCTDKNMLKCKTLHLKGSLSATMSRKTACAIDKILKIKGNISMEKQSIKEHSSTLIYEIEF